MHASPPNILWIVTTQWRAHACGYAGDVNVRTPHLDALAAQSMNYAQAVTPHPFGPFARAALLTGVASPQNGVRDYFDPLPAEARTIAHAMRERGYATGFFGKWHLGRRDPTAPLVGEAHAKTFVPPDSRGGFEAWEGFESGFLLNDPWLHGTRIETPRKFNGYQSDIVCERAAGWIADRGRGQQIADGSLENRRAENRNWFAVVSLEAPHPPYDAPAAGIAARDPAALILPRNVPRGSAAEARARAELAGYYAHIEATDRAIGRLLQAVHTEDTVVVFTSVHGDMHGAHGLFRKGWPHEESVRVPLLVRHTPNQQGSECGVRSVELVTLLDVQRWTVAWAEGRQLQAPNSERRTPNSERPTRLQRISMPSVVALPQQCDRVWRGVRTDARKLILNANGSPWLFFDLERDPWEENNLVDDRSRCDEIAALAASVD